MRPRTAFERALAARAGQLEIVDRAVGGELDRPAVVRASAAPGTASTRRQMAAPRRNGAAWQCHSANLLDSRRLGNIGGAAAGRNRVALKLAATGLIATRRRAVGQEVARRMACAARRAPKWTAQEDMMAGTVEKKLADLGIVLPHAGGAGRQLCAVRAHRQFAGGFRPALPRCRRQAGGQGQARRRRLGRGRPEGGARLRDQRARPAQGRARRSRQGRRAWCGSAASSIRRRTSSTAPR